MCDGPRVVLYQWPLLEPSVVFDADVYAQHEVTELYVERVGIVGYLGQAQAALTRFEFAYVGLGLAEFLGNGVLGHVCFATHGFEFNADGAIEIRIHTAGLYCPQGYIPKRDVKSYRTGMSPLRRVLAMMALDVRLWCVPWLMAPDGTSQRVLPDDGFGTQKRPCLRLRRHGLGDAVWVR